MQLFPSLFSVALQSLKELGRLTHMRFLELFRHIVGLLGRVISPSQGLYLHRTTRHRKTRTNIHALSGIRAHDPSNQTVKTRASDRTATVTGYFLHTNYIMRYVRPVKNNLLNIFLYVVELLLQYMLRYLRKFSKNEVTDFDRILLQIQIVRILSSIL
jgi:hypothetical protein